MTRVENLQAWGAVSCRAPTSARPHMREKQHGGLGGVNAELGQAKELRY